MIVLDNKFELGQSVYLKTDRDQYERLVVGVCQKPTGVLYELAYSTQCSWHYDFEMTVEKNVVTATTN